MRPSDERLKLVAMRFGFPLNVSVVPESLAGCGDGSPKEGVGNWLMPLFASLARTDGLLASTPFVRSGAGLPLAIPEPIGIDGAIELLGCPSTVACDPIPVEPKALLGGPARCDAAVVGGPSTGAEAT